MSHGDLRFYDDDVKPGALEEYHRLLRRHPEIGEWIEREHQVSHRFDIPCVACSNMLGNRQYIDRHTKIVRPLIQKPAGKTVMVNIVNFLIMGHERPEKALLVVFPTMSYEARHHLATAREKEMVESAGYTWKSYRTEMRKSIKADQREKIDICPPDMDESPLDGQPTLLVKVREAMARAKGAGKGMFMKSGKKAKSSVDYSEGHAGSRCGICVHFLSPHACTLVDGNIDPSMWCKLFDKEKQA